MFDYDFDGEAVIRELGIEGSAPEFKQQMLVRLHELLNQRVGIRVEEEMNDEDLQTFNNLLKEGDQKAKDWLTSRFPNYEEMYQEELQELVQELKRTLDSTVASIQDRK